MSGFFGIFNRNGKQVDRKIANHMLDAMSYWNPDEKDIWIDGPIALGHAMLRNTPESKHEHLPLWRDVYVLTMDARIDNREKLAKDIELPDRPMSKIGDSEFILGAYKKWGEESPKYLLGDFAFAIWDAQKEQIFCAKDHIGVRQLYYFISEECYVFGNDIKVLLKHPHITKNINDEAVANYFINDQLNSRKMTFFQDISKLPPAHTLILKMSHFEMKQYWDINERPKIELQDFNAYRLELRKLLEKAVYCRLRSDFSIASHLSGGSDSSAISVIAARKLNKESKKLLAFNWLHEPENDDDITNFEWANSRAIADREGIEHHYVNLDDQEIFHYILNRDIAYGETVGFWYEYKVRSIVQKRGCRTILSGWGGDDFVTYKGRAYFADLISQGKIIYAFKEAIAYLKRRNRYNIKSFLSLIYFKIILPFVPRKLYCYIPKSNCEKINNPFPMIKKHFLPLVKKSFKEMNYLSRQSGKNMRDDMLTYWARGGIHTRLESWATEAIVNRLEYAYPMLDKRLIEFMLEVPTECLMRNQEGRYLFRMAVSDLIPKDILWMGKEEEKNRVDHYLSLLVSVYKKLADNNFTKTQSKYINTFYVSKALNQIDKETLFENYIEIDASISILLSKLLNNYECGKTG
jgi:asparagine synthase (glutamine-hydrolysing)